MMPLEKGQGGVPMDERREEQIFIDGKSQIVEMFRIMGEEEKIKLLRSVGLKNPALAKELLEKSLSFDHIAQLDEQEMEEVLNRISPAVLGMALKGESEEFQRQILSTIDRDYAEQAYATMAQSVPNEQKYAARARRKILDIMGGLSHAREIAI